MAFLSRSRLKRGASPFLFVYAPWVRDTSGCAEEALCPLLPSALLDPGLRMLCTFSFHLNKSNCFRVHQNCELYVCRASVSWKFPIMTKPQRSNKQNVRMQLLIHVAMTGRSTTPGTLLPSPSDSITQTWSRSAAASSYFWGFPVQRAELSTPALLSPRCPAGVMAPLQDGLILST